MGGVLQGAMTLGDTLLDDFCTPARAAGLFDAAKGFVLEDWHFEGLALRRAMGAGSGPVVLVLHGWGSGGQHMLGLARALVRAGMRPVVIDFPAHGASGGTQTTMLHCGRAIEALIDQLAPIGICAHSFGAMAAAMLCGGHPYFGGRAHSAIKLALISPGYSLEWSVQRHCREHALTNAQQSALRTAIVQRFQVDISQFHLAAIAANLPDDTQVFHDCADEIIALADIRAIFSAAPHIPLHVLQGYGHDRILMARPVLRQVSQFFKMPACGLQ